MNIQSWQIYAEFSVSFYWLRMSLLYCELSRKEIIPWGLLLPFTPLGGRKESCC